MADTNKSLQDFFESARNAKPPISKEESQSFIEKHGADGHAHSQQTTSKFFRKITPMKAFSAVAITALTAGSMYYYAHRAPITDNAAFVAESPVPVAVAASDTAKKSDAPKIEQRFKIEIRDDNSSSPASSTLNNLLFTNSASTFKLFLGALGEPGMKDSLALGMHNFSHVIDSIKAVFNAITIDTSASHGVTIHNIPGMNHDTTVDIPASEHMTRRELVEKLDSAKAMINNLSSIIALDTSYPGNPAIAINKEYINKMSKSANSSEIETYKQIEDSPDSAHKKRIILRSDAIYSTSPSDVNFSINALNGTQNIDSANSDAASLQSDIDSVKKQLSTNSHSALMDSVRTMIDDIAIDTSSSSDPSITINKKNVNEITVSKNGQRSEIKIFRTYKLANGDSTPIMIRVKPGSERSDNETATNDYFTSKDTLTFNMNLRNGTLTINSMEIDTNGSMTPELFRGLYLETAHLNAITFDTASYYPDLKDQHSAAFSTEPESPKYIAAKPDMHITIHDAFVGGNSSLTATIQNDESHMLPKVLHTIQNLKSTLNSPDVRTKLPLTMDTIGSDHVYSFSIMPHDSIVSIQIYKIYLDSTMHRLLDKYAASIHNTGAAPTPEDPDHNAILKTMAPFSGSLNEPADSSFLNAILPYVDSPKDSCVQLLAQSLHKFRMHDSLSREKRFAQGKSTVGSSMMFTASSITLSKSGNGTDSSLKNRSSEEYYATPTHSMNSNIKIDNAVNVQGTRLITLSAAGMAHLGIVSCSSGICMYRTEYYNPVDQYFEYIGMGGSASLNTCRFNGLNYNSPVPALTTDDHGTVRSITYDRTKVNAELAKQIESMPFGSQQRFQLEKKLSDEARIATMRQINTFIPVIVRTGHIYTAHDSALGYMRPDLILWYEPTPELLALLPDSLKSQLSTELAAADSTIHKVELTLLTTDSIGVNLPEIAAPPKVSVPPTSVVPDTNQEKYFDLWRNASGAITASLVYPNPTSGEFTVKYTLADARTVTATLHDISGHEIQTLGRESSAAGSSTINVHLQGVAPGIYLVALTTDKGEQAVQRLIVEH